MGASDCIATNFNRSRAEGKDKRETRRSLPCKKPKLNPTSTIAYIQVLGTGMDTEDTSPSILLFFDKQRFLFNAGEGLQRFCTEFKIKLTKINHIFLSRVCSETTGGIPGLLLTLAGIGEVGMSVNLWGPSDLRHLLEAMKCFIPHSSMVHANVYTCGSSSSFAAEASTTSNPTVLVDNEVVKISAISLLPKTSVGNEIPHGTTAALYLCELPNVLGKFHPDKAMALGLKPGPKYGKLQSGESVLSEEKNIVVHPSDVMDPPSRGPIVIIVDCPTKSHLSELLSTKHLNNYYADSGDSLDHMTAVTCIVHLTPAAVANSSIYNNWMEKFGKAQHIMAGHGMKNASFPILMSCTKNAARLNYLCPTLFPSSGFSSYEQHNAQCYSWDKDFVVDSCKLLHAENLIKFVLRPQACAGMDCSNVPAPLNHSMIVSELVARIPEIVQAALEVQKLWHGGEAMKRESTSMEDDPITRSNPCMEEIEILPPKCLDHVRRDDLEIVFLGTGSSQPSKYRNVSSIYIDLFSKGSLLLDCGEGTLGQLHRRYGADGADNALRSLNLIWISHIHADHHTGLTRILTARRDLLLGKPHDPLPVIGPRLLKRFVVAYQDLEDLDMCFIDCESTTEASWTSPWSGPDSDENSALKEQLKNVLSHAGLEHLISFPVVHCPHAYGVSLKASERVNSVGQMIPGWKIVYSGDTRPCKELIEASRSATVLIHEATFEDALLEEAIDRNHSTTGEAIEMGESAGVYRVILTHFSQRYPKIPVVEKMRMGKACVAFDLMSINIADVHLLPNLLPYLELLFKDEIVDDLEKEPGSNSTAN